MSVTWSSWSNTERRLFWWLFHRKQNSCGSIVPMAPCRSRGSTTPLAFQDGTTSPWTMMELRTKVNSFRLCFASSRNLKKEISSIYKNFKQVQQLPRPTFLALYAHKCIKNLIPIIDNLTQHTPSPTLLAVESKHCVCMKTRFHAC